MRFEVDEYRKTLINPNSANVAILWGVIMNWIELDRVDKAELDRERRSNLPRIHEDLPCVAGEEQRSKSPRRRGNKKGENGLLENAAPAKPTDVCNNCGEQGHWAAFALTFLGFLLSA